jgi:hypothetical protein
MKSLIDVLAEAGQEAINDGMRQGNQVEQDSYLSQNTPNE